MCKIMEDMKNEAAREAEKRRSIEIALDMLGERKYAYEYIAKLVRMTVDEVKALDEGKPA